MSAKTFEPIAPSLVCWSCWGQGSWKHTWRILKTAYMVHGCKGLCVEKLSKRHLRYFWTFPQKINCFVMFNSQVLLAAVLTQPGFLWTGVLKILSFPLSYAYPAVVGVPFGQPGCAALVARQLLPSGIYNDRVLPALFIVSSPILVSL